MLAYTYVEPGRFALTEKPRRAAASSAAVRLRKK